MKPFSPTASAAPATSLSSSYAGMTVALVSLNIASNTAAAAAKDDANDKLDDKSAALAAQKQSSNRGRQSTRNPRRSPVSTMRTIIVGSEIANDPRNYDLGPEFHTPIFGQPSRDTAATAAAPIPVGPDIKSDIKRNNESKGDNKYIAQRLPQNLQDTMLTLFSDLRLKYNQNSNPQEKAKVKLQINFLKELNKSIKNRLGIFPFTPNSIYSSMLYTQELQQFRDKDLINQNTLMSNLFDEIEHYWSTKSDKRIKVACNPCCHQICPCVPCVIA